jgi:hypothetical protein
MFAEVMEWEAKGDSLRRARRFDQAAEAYRRALRHCFQWTRSGDGARTCSEIREKIWSVQMEQFDAMTVDPGAQPPPPGADVIEWNAAMLWAKGSREEAECAVQAAVRRGTRSSGEFLDRMAARWMDRDPEGALRLTDWACRLRGEANASAVNA